MVLLLGEAAPEGGGRGRLPSGLRSVDNEFIFAAVAICGAYLRLVRLYDLVLVA